MPVVLPERIERVCNVFLATDGIIQPEVNSPGHLLYLTNGGVRICHWVIMVPRVEGLGLDRLGGYAADPWANFVGWVMEEYPHRIRVGVAPFSPYAPCPFNA